MTTHFYLDLDKGLGSESTHAPVLLHAPCSCSSPGVVEAGSRGRSVGAHRFRSVAAPFGRPRVILATLSTPAPAPVGTPAGRTFAVRTARPGIIGTSAGSHHRDGFGTIGTGLDRQLPVRTRHSPFLGLTVRAGFNWWFAVCTSDWLMRSIPLMLASSPTSSAPSVSRKDNTKD